MQLHRGHVQASLGVPGFLFVVLEDAKSRCLAEGSTDGGELRFLGEDVAQVKGGNDGGAQCDIGPTGDEQERPQQKWACSAPDQGGNQQTKRRAKKQFWGKRKVVPEQDARDIGKRDQEKWSFHHYQRLRQRPRNQSKSNPRAAP